MVAKFLMIEIYRLNYLKKNFVSYYHWRLEYQDDNTGRFSFWSVLSLDLAINYYINCAPKYNDQAVVQHINSYVRKGSCYI